MAWKTTKSLRTSLLSSLRAPQVLLTSIMLGAWILLALLVVERIQATCHMRQGLRWSSCVFMERNYYRIQNQKCLCFTAFPWLPKICKIVSARRCGVCNMKAYKHAAKVWYKAAK